MKKIIIYIVLLCVVIISCDERQLTTYDGDIFIQFEKEYSDSTSLMFIYFPDQDVIDWPIVLEIIGVASNKDLTYKITVNDNLTTAESNHYSLSNEMILKAGNYRDTFNIKLNKTPDLDNKQVRLFLQIEATSDLHVGKIEKSMQVINFTNSVSRPAWWDSDMTTMYLGTYSDKKYRLFIQVTNEYDLSDKDMSDIRSLALQFGQYLIDNPTLEDDGTRMDVTVLGLKWD